MKKSQIILTSFILIFIFFLVYTPHYVNPYPIHIDEWRHITEALKIKKGEYSFGWNSLEIGFHLFLTVLSFFIDLVLFYKFLPALWAVLTSMILFYISYKITDKNFFISIFTIIFFASIKSNVNILGLWFFTPLTFSIPFIFLYINFFTQGIEKQNKRYILTSLFIMILLIFTHAPSLLFAVPFLLIYSLFNYKYLEKEWRFFSLFLLIPMIGILFFSFANKNLIATAFLHLTKNLQFKYGWGVLELDNSLLETYSLIGYILAIIGILGIFSFQKKYNKYLIYILWPITVLTSIILFRIIKISYLSPYQRNLYYFTISLPFLSAIGFYYIIKLVKIQISKLNFNQTIKSSQKIITIFIITIILILTFAGYFNLPKQTLLYKAIDNDDYQALLFLSQFAKAKVLATLGVSTAVYPISGHDIVATIFFDYPENKEDVKEFFKTEDCREKQEIINKHNVKYILTKNQTNCNWIEIYNKGDYIYDVNAELP